MAIQNNCDVCGKEVSMNSQYRIQRKRRTFYFELPSFCWDEVDLCSTCIKNVKTAAYGGDTPR